MTDKLANECHGYDLEGYPIGDASDCPSAIAAKLARCNEIARGQALKSKGRLRGGCTDEDRLIHRHNLHVFFGARQLGQEAIVDAGAAYLNALNA